MRRRRGSRRGICPTRCRSISGGGFPARLARAGFTNLLWLREGVEAWREAGLPMASAPRSVPRGAPHRAEASRIPIQEDAGFPGPASASVVVYRSLVYHRRRPSTSEEKQMPWIVPIPGTTKLHRLQENVAAVSVELNREDRRDIEIAGSQLTVQGARYSESSQRMVDR